MFSNNKVRKLLALLLAAVFVTGLLPLVYAEEPDVEESVNDVTSFADNVENDVTEPEPIEEPAEKPAPEPAEEPMPETAERDTPAPAEKPTEKPAEEPTEETAPETMEESEPESIEEEITPNPEPEWDPSAEEDEPEEESDEDEEEDSEEDDEDEELFEFDDDDVGSVSEELLEQFNNPDTFEHIEFNGTADIELREKSFRYGDEVTLVAKVQNVNMSYRLVWEANDGDGRGWYTIGSGNEYSFIVTPEIMDREYRVIIFTVD